MKEPVCKCGRDLRCFGCGLGSPDCECDNLESEDAVERIHPSFGKKDGGA